MSQHPTAQQIELFFQEGGSDKVYRAQIEERAGGWVVQFQYGRRGAALTAGSKTPAPVPYEKALAIYTKLVAEKQAKGYTPQEGGARFAGTEKAGDSTGVACQLLNAVDEDVLESLLRDPRYVAQQKFDGERRLVRKTEDGEIFGINRLSLRVALPQSVTDVFAMLPYRSLIVDGEIVGDRLFVFDLLELGGIDMKPLGCKERIERLNAGLADHLAAVGGDAVEIAESFYGEADKRKLLVRVREQRLEGVTFKDVDAPYQPGRPNSGGSQLKFKLTAQASVVVAGANPGKRSVRVEAFDDTSGAAVPLGSVTIPPNAEIPAAGAIIEVEYLYAFPDGALFQPRFKALRSDILRESCRTSQLKYFSEHQTVKAVAASKSRP